MSGDHQWNKVQRLYEPAIPDDISTALLFDDHPFHTLEDC
jgi:hypothetical protein